MGVASELWEHKEAVWALGSTLVLQFCCKMWTEILLLLYKYTKSRKQEDLDKLRLVSLTGGTASDLEGLREKKLGVY